MEDFRGTDVEFDKHFRDMWFKFGAFRHVFAGELNSRDAEGNRIIGGLHNLIRFIKLQEKIHYHGFIKIDDVIHIFALYSTDEV